MKTQKGGWESSFDLLPGDVLLSTPFDPKHEGGRQGRKATGSREHNRGRVTAETHLTAGGNWFPASSWDLSGVPNSCQPQSLFPKPQDPLPMVSNSG